MNWVDRVLSSDAGKCSREKAEGLIKEAGGSIPVDAVGLPEEAGTSERPASQVDDA